MVLFKEELETDMMELKVVLFLGMSINFEKCKKCFFGIEDVFEKEKPTCTSYIYYRVVFIVIRLCKSLVPRLDIQKYIILQWALDIIISSCYTMDLQPGKPGIPVQPSLRNSTHLKNPLICQAPYVTNYKTCLAMFRDL